jgi:hypothetical protein
VFDDPQAGEPSAASPGRDDAIIAAAPAGQRPQLPMAHDAASDRVCPFLRAATGTTLSAPVDAPDEANRCAALAEPVPQSLRQQELVCLSSGHVNCPRFLRGSVAHPPALQAVSARRTITPATGAAMALFGLAFVASVGFVVATGGLAMTVAISTATPGGAVLGDVSTAAAEPVRTPAPTIEITPIPSVAAAASPAVSASPALPSPTSATPSATPSAPPSQPPSATPEPTAKPTAKPASGRFALLTRCAGTADCYVYIVRSGDNLFSIARYFGVPLKTVQAMNPWTKSGLVAGRELRIPTPTR